MKIRNGIRKMQKYGVPTICTLLLFVIVACTPSTEELSTQTAEPTLEPSTPTPLPTNTPSPTNTAIPTNTLSPTKVSTSDPYTKEFRTGLSVYLDAMNDYIDMVIDVAADRNRARDDEWKQNAVEKLNTLDQAATQLESIPDVPDRYAQLDAYSDALAAETHKLVENFSYFVEHNDGAAYERSMQNLDNTTALLKDVVEEGKRVLAR